MPQSSAGIVLDHLQKLLQPQTLATLPDGCLLERWVKLHEEFAFVTLLRRHGPMVWALCRRTLHQEQDAEDVFQATFLVLAHKAGTIHKRASVGSWLYGVAFRLAQRLRRENALRSRNEGRASSAAPTDPAVEVGQRELQTLLDEALDRLPEKWRTPLVLCDLEGLSQQDAAHQLGWSRGTLKRRLERGRAVLRRRLGHRGLGGVSGVVAALVLPDPSAAAIPPTLLHLTRQAALVPTHAPAAMLFSTKVLHLTEGVFRTMMLAKWKTGAVAMLVLSLLGAGTGVVSYRTFADSGPKDTPQRSVGSFLVDGKPREAKDGGATPPQPAAQDDQQPRMAETWSLKLTLSDYSDSVKSIAFSPDGRYLVTGGNNQKVRWYDPATGVEERSFVPDLLYVQSLAFSPDGKWLALGGGNNLGRPGSIVLWDCRKQGRVPFGQHADVVTRVAFSPDGTLLASAALDGSVKIWDVDTMKQWKALPPQTQPVCDVKFSPDGKTLAVAGGEVNVEAGRATKPGVLELWDVATGKQRRRLQRHRGTVVAVAFSPDGKLLASGGFDDAIVLWDVATGNIRAALQGHTAPVGSIAFSPDERLFATASYDETVGIWDVATGRLRSRLKIGKGVLNSVAFSPDGHLLAVASGRTRYQEASLGMPQVQLWSQVPAATKPQDVIGAGRRVEGKAERLTELLHQLLQSNKTDEQITEALVLATQARLATDSERALVKKARAQRKDRAQVFEELLERLILK